MPKILVEENGKQMEVFLPNTGDAGYDKELKESYIAKTKEQLRKRPVKEVSKKSKEEQSGALKEFIEFRNRQKTDHPKKYF
jgi:23S rRNA maturation mini-RNase III